MQKTSRLYIHQPLSPLLFTGFAWSHLIVSRHLALAQPNSPCFRASQKDVFRSHYLHWLYVALMLVWDCTISLPCFWSLPELDLDATRHDHLVGTPLRWWPFWQIINNSPPFRPRIYPQRRYYITGAEC